MNMFAVYMDISEYVDLKTRLYCQSPMQSRVVVPCSLSQSILLVRGDHCVGNCSSAASCESWVTWNICTSSFLGLCFSAPVLDFIIT